MDRSDLHISRSCPCQSIHSSQDFLEKYFIFIFSFILPYQHIRLMPYHFHFFICQSSSYKGRHFHIIREIVFPILTFGEERSRPLALLGKKYRITFKTLTEGMFLHMKRFELIQKVLPWKMKIFAKISWFSPET